jgi:hypothetical protein
VNKIKTPRVVFSMGLFYFIKVSKLFYNYDYKEKIKSFNLECSKQILLVKIKTDDDEIITKKISN